LGISNTSYSALTRENVQSLRDGTKTVLAKVDTFADGILAIKVLPSFCRSLLLLNRSILLLNRSLLLMAYLL
jgi:hypothetical protein